MVATLDHLSGGRVSLGVGVATTRDEFENLGVDFTTRGKRMDEILGALQALWTQETPAFTGTFYNFSGLEVLAEAVAKAIPALVDRRLQPRRRFGAPPASAMAGTPCANRRRKSRRGSVKIVELTEATGRDPAGLDISLTILLHFTGKPPSKPLMERTALTGTEDDIAATVAAYRDAGLDEIVISDSSADMDSNTDVMTRFMEQVWPKL